MAYRSNFSNQISIYDSFEMLSDRKKNMITKSWAKGFAEAVFPAINSDAFRVLYKDNDASRPSTPANYIIGLLLIKEMLGYTDEETVEAAHFDVRIQYALHSTSLKEQPVSDRTLSRFRERLYNYEQETGIDLLHDEMQRLSDVFCKYLHINKKLKRMDSLMVSTHAKAMSRLEVIYTTVSRCVALLNKKNRNDLIPEEMHHYLEDDDLNDVIYYAKSEDVNPRLQKVIDEAYLMKDIMSGDEWLETTEYQLLIRVLKEQSDDNGKPKDKKQIRSDSMQNPNDADATYRKKAGKDHKGYVGNIIEAVGDNGATQIVDFSYDRNIHADQDFSKEYIENNSDETMIADGAYGSVELQEMAEKKNITLVTTCLTGKDPDPVFAEYRLNEEGTEVIACAQGHTPLSSTYSENTGRIRMKMALDKCSTCPMRERCRAQMQKKEAVVSVSKKMIARAEYLKKLGTEEYKTLTRQRNAVEGVMSVLRRRYRVDEIPVFGKNRSKQFFYLKVGAFNVVKLLTHMGKNPQKQEGYAC